MFINVQGRIMENALQTTKFLNFSRKTEPCLVDPNTPSLSKKSPVPSPTKHKIETTQRRPDTEQRVLLWFLSKGIKRCDPCSIYDEFKEIQRKKIAEGRENVRPS